jgi:uncharacterized coiled-coil DUF342 family protein
MDARELSQKLDRVQSTGNISQITSTLQAALQAVRQFCVDLHEEIELAGEAQKLADQLKSVTRENEAKRRSGTELTTEEDRAEKDAQDLVDKAMRARRNVDKKKSALKELASSIEQLRTEVNRF